MGNAYDGFLARSVAQTGGVDKLLHQGRKVTDRISIEVLEGKNIYELKLMESDGSIIVENEKFGVSIHEGKPTFLDSGYGDWFGQNYEEVPIHCSING